jgi:hypothetical protein
MAIPENTAAPALLKELANIGATARHFRKRDEEVCSFIQMVSFSADSKQSSWYQFSHR